MPEIDKSFKSFHQQPKSYVDKTVKEPNFWLIRQLRHSFAAVIRPNFIAEKDLRLASDLHLQARDISAECARHPVTSAAAGDGAPQSGGAN